MKNIVQKVTALMLCLIINACSSDDNTSKNEAPIIAAQSFTVSEFAEDTEVIGTVTATDMDADALSFSMVSNDNNLFEITTTGELSLATGKALDYETTTSHSITVQVTDNTLSATATITIDVTDEFDAFVTTWETTTANESITIPIHPDYTYNYTVDWGDGSTSEDQTGAATHTYTNAATHTVSITGEFPVIYFFTTGSTVNNEKIQTIEQWGDMVWKSMERAFYKCSNLTSNAIDTPDLSLVTNTSGMFERAISFNSNINNWDVSNVTNMIGMFLYASAFNSNLDNWDVSNVMYMSNMFRSASSFNGDVSTWDVSQVMSMNNTFSHTKYFNGDISAWDVSAVTDMNFMFDGASSFNGDLSSWDVSSVTSMGKMFQYATSFTGDLSTWDVSSAVIMSRVFFGATSFDRDLGSWDISSAKTMELMLDNTGLSIANYDATLKGWSELSTVPSNIELGANGLKYCNVGETARTTLIAMGWTFSGDTKGSDAECQ